MVDSNLCNALEVCIIGIIIRGHNSSNVLRIEISEILEVTVNEVNLSVVSHIVAYK